MEIKAMRLRFILSGIAAGIINGFFGGGGGLLLVPMLSDFCGLDTRTSLATSVAVMLPLCIVSAAVYYFRVGISFSMALPYLLGGLAGGIIGGTVLRKAPIKLLRIVFALLMLYGGVRNIG